jgi:gentisate 1,2-dioxygenase
MPDDLAPRGFYEGLTARSLMAGWARREHPTGSKSNMCVHVWRAAEARAALQEASRFVGTDVAERRNLIMVNPAPGNTYATTRNIVAAYQMIQPGETARSHRHTPAALRLVLDAADDVYTVVDGMRVDMTPGDVVLTPSWCWHGHANDGSETAFWLDFLDVPFVRHLEATLFEPHP